MENLILRLDNWYYNNLNKVSSFLEDKVKFSQKTQIDLSYGIGGTTFIGQGISNNTGIEVLFGVYTLSKMFFNKSQPNRDNKPIPFRYLDTVILTEGYLLSLLGVTELIRNADTNNPEILNMAINITLIGVGLLGLKTGDYIKRPIEE